MARGLTLGIIGVGNLGGALAEGALARGAVARVVASDVDEQRLADLRRSIGDGFRPAATDRVAELSDVLVISVKPHIVPRVLSMVREARRPDVPLVSVAAGVQLGRIERDLPPGSPVVRAMPNLAMVVGQSATALTANRFVSSGQLDQVESIFQAVGTVVRVEESQMHAVTGLSGSGPAYVALMVEGLVAGGVRKGLSPAVARRLACQLLLGTATLLSEKDLHPAVLIDRVTTPAGTTIAGLRELETRGVRGALLAAVEAASERSEELAGS